MQKCVSSIKQGTQATCRTGPPSAAKIPCRPSTAPPEGQHCGALRCAPAQHSVRVAGRVPDRLPPAVHDTSMIQAYDILPATPNLTALMLLIAGPICTVHRNSITSSVCAKTHSSKPNSASTNALRPWQLHPSSSAAKRTLELTLPGRTAQARSSLLHTRCLAHLLPDTPAATSTAAGWLR